MYRHILEQGVPNGQATPAPPARNDTLCEEDYPSIKYWHKQMWSDKYKVLSKENKGKKCTTDSIKFYFIEADNGDLVSPSRRKQIKDASLHLRLPRPWRSLSW